MEWHALISNIETKNIEEALKDENWIIAMHEELNQFKRNDGCMQSSP